MIQTQNNPTAMAPERCTDSLDGRLVAVETQLESMSEVQRTQAQTLDKIWNKLDGLSQPRPANWPAIVTATIAVLVVAGSLLTMWLKSEINPLNGRVNGIEKDNEWFYSVTQQRFESTDAHIGRLYEHTMGERPEPFTPKRSVTTKGSVN